MKKFTLSLLICFVFFKTIEASHIVGGEFELRHIENYQYRLNLIQYFDDATGNPEAEDQDAPVYIFRKSDNALMSTIILNNVGSEFVDYTNPECAIAELATRKILYTKQIELSPEIYNDPQGYYVIYERCCRNNFIDNINPDFRSNSGQTFYLEFPPVVKDGKAFVDTTPILLPPLSDYAVINRPFYFDFSGTDLDDDSLVYSLAHPLNSSVTDVGRPTIPSPAPYPLIELADGISVNNLIPGSPSLRISQNGLLTLTPSELGLFVFAVIVEEFRNGEKIGEVRRDFQMLVIDYDPGENPIIKARVKGETEFYQEGTTLQFGLEAEKCLELFVTDADPEEVITVEAIGVNFDQNIQDLISPRLSILNGPNDTLKLDFCLPDCPYMRGPMIIDLIAYDDACSVPLRDTLRLTIEVDGPQNSDPFIVGNPNILNVNLNVGENYELEIQGLDEDEDVLILEAFGDDFDLDDLGIELREQLLVPGEVKKVLTWTPDCEAFDFRAQNEFTVFVELDDESECGLGEPDRLEIRFTINLPDNNRPKITLDGLEETEITVRINEQISFDVIAEDVDSDLLDLRAVGDGFELADYSINFPGNSGIRKISSPFGWRLSCNDIDLAERSTFDIIFLSTDQTGCSDPATDSLRVRVNVLPPNNDAPTVFIRDIEADSVRGAVGAPVVLDVIGTDENESDILTLRLAEVQLNGQPLDLEITSFRFQNARGRGSVSSRFFWVPDCSLLPPDFVEGFFTLVFTVDDDQCFNSKSDTTSIVISVGVLPLEFDEFEPKNAFTPNGDGSGDFFHLNFCNNVTNGCDLPSGTCANSFQRIEIYNRWGRLVYQSGEPNFQWHAQDMPGGAYFYLVHYTREVYKGQVFIHVPAIE